jgi:cytochrome c oxidase subunit 4
MEGAMEHGHKEPNYVLVWIWLGVLTIVEVVVAISGWLPWKATVASLIGLAFIKAIMVAMYFMHLRFERKAMVLVLMAPVVLSFVLFFGVLPDV